MRPFIISIGTTCNNHCRFCSVADLRGPATEVDATVAHALELARDGGAKQIDFVGGEPTLHEKLPDWIEKARKLGADSVGLQTNGRRLAYPGYAARLADAGLTAVEVSLHGHTAALHEYHTDTPGSFKQSVTGIRRALEAGLDVVVETTITRSNARHLPQIAQALGALAVSQWRLRQTLCLGDGAANAIRVVPRWTTTVYALHEALPTTRVKGISFVLEGVPPCVATSLPLGSLTDTRGFGHVDACGDCALTESCEGPEARYVEIFGAEELVALSEAPSNTGAGADNPIRTVGGLGRPPTDSENSLD